MKRTGYIKYLWVVIAMLAIEAYGQQSDNDPNALYERFSEAYRKMDAGMVEELYLKNAVLLNLYDSSDPNSIWGNVAIATYFSDFFERLKKNGSGLKLTFKITGREQREDVILDNGYYALTMISADSSKTTSYGKLSTILKKDDGIWKFSVDSNTNTQEIEYHNASTAAIPQPNGPRN